MSPEIVSITSLYRLNYSTRFAVDDAAPVKPTPAILALLRQHFVVPSSTTHDVASSDVHWCAVTSSPFGAERTRLTISLAEVVWLHGIDQVFDGGLFDRIVFGNEILAAVAAGDFDGAVEIGFEAVADVTKCGHFLPAGLESTGARKAVAFTFTSHVLGDGLWMGRTKRKKKNTQTKMLFHEKYQRDRKWKVKNSVQKDKWPNNLIKPFLNIHPVYLIATAFPIREFTGFISKMLLEKSIGSFK